MDKMLGLFITHMGEDKNMIADMILVYSPIMPLPITRKRVMNQIESLPGLVLYMDKGHNFMIEIAQYDLEKLGCSTKIVEGTFAELNAAFMKTTNYDGYTLIDYFTECLSPWYQERNNTDCMTLWEHKEKNNSEFPTYRKNFGIGLDEEILFTRDTSSWNDKDEGLVITDKAIYYHPYSESYAIRWTDIDHVVYKEYSFYFYNVREEQLMEIEKKYFFKKISNEKIESYVGENLAYNLTIIANIAGEEIGLYDEVVYLEDTEQYDDALTKLEGMIQKPEIKDDAFAHFLKGKIMLRQDMKVGRMENEQRFNAIEKEFMKAEELSSKALENALRVAEVSGDYTSICNDSPYTFDHHTCNYWRAYNHLHYGNKDKARNLFIDAMSADVEEISEDAKEMYMATEMQMSDQWNHFTSIYEYKDRKFVMPVKDNQIAGCWTDNISTFRMSNIPSCIIFPTGHPVANELYIGHPYNPVVYVPYEDSEDVFFVDKINELCYLLQCLGAEEISITSIKGKSVNELNNYETQIGGQADIKAFSINGEWTNAGSVERNTSNNIQRTIVQRFDPLKKPFVPEKLIWYSEQTKWQRLVESRLNGNLLEYNEFISTSDTRFVSTSEREAIKANAKYLWSKIGCSIEDKTETQFRESVETQWKVEVKFRSMKQFDIDTPSSTIIEKSISRKYTESEQEYLENIKEFYADDTEITPRERKMLDRIRQSLGISEERATELEASLKPQLTEDEQEYLEMFWVYAERGELTEKERRRLDKFAAALGIDENRIKEIEQLTR